MAEKTINNEQTELESIVNRWIVDYYVLRALESFRKDQYEDFCNARDILQKVLQRAVERTNVTEPKIRVLQFLTRINEGENLELSFERDKSITPLESALVMLENWKECNFVQADLGFEKVYTSVKEMIVGILIKNGKFDKANEVLKKHFPGTMVGKKATFMGLIRQKNNTHKIIDQMDFHQFKEEMLAYCKTLCKFDVPFLHRVAKQVIDKRLQDQDDMAADDGDESDPSSTPPLVSWKHTIMQKNRLKAAYQALATSSDEKSFAQLEEEVEKEGYKRQEDGCICLSHTPNKGTSGKNVREERLFQRQSGSPMEASPADQPPQADGVQTQANILLKTPTVAQLVMQPDSQLSSQCTVATLELQTEVRTEESAELPTVSNVNNLQCPITENDVTPPIRKLPRRGNRTFSRASTSWAELSEDTEEDHSVHVTNRENCMGKVHNKSNGSLIRSIKKSKKSLSDSKKDPQESFSAFQTPVKKHHDGLASNPLSKDPDSTDEVCITDSSLDHSPGQSPLDSVPQTSSTPHKVSTEDKDAPHSKWRQLLKEAKETKETWSDEESCVIVKNNTRLNESTSNPSHRKRKWTSSETERLKEGVKRFGEGNWSKIRTYCKFNDRTNVNLKDRWRTMKNANMV
ncbi:telomeric repeat binding factor a isoform X2 [Anabas testudineus]|uniref:telomeric repeat binding factor a isoform X2 n=1 Tax=Anabas testudineus TaxID=64144 RepID=UPI000E4602C4|nr:telomeric repeat binding factor a isoform X2 [Anabas testudineus]